MYGWDRYGGTYSTKGWSPGEASGLQLVLAFGGVVLLIVLIVLFDEDLNDTAPEVVLFLGLMVVLFFLACVEDAHPVGGGRALVVVSGIATLLSALATGRVWFEWQYFHREVVGAAIFLAYSTLAFIPALVSLRKAMRERRGFR